MLAKLQNVAKSMNTDAKRVFEMPYLRIVEKKQSTRNYHCPMPTRPHPFPDTAAWGRALKARAGSWWYLVHFAAIVLVVALSPSTYSRAYRATTAKDIYTSTWQVLPWFTVVASLFSLVLIRIVVVTALSYGLSQYALQMVVRVLVLELIPLSAALFVALRSGLVFTGQPPAGGPPSPTEPTPQLSMAQLRQEVVPHVVAEAFSVITLAMVSSVIALVLAYLTVYGFSLWGVPGYTRTVGHVFDMPVTVGFALKTLLFSLAVAIVPTASRLEAARQSRAADAVQPGAVRLFLVLLLVEATSLAVKYV